MRVELNAVLEVLLLLVLVLLHGEQFSIRRYSIALVPDLPIDAPSSCLRAIYTIIVG